MMWMGGINSGASARRQALGVFRHCARTQLAIPIADDGSLNTQRRFFVLQSVRDDVNVGCVASSGESSDGSGFVAFGRVLKMAECPLSLALADVENRAVERIDVS